MRMRIVLLLFLLSPAHYGAAQGSSGPTQRSELEERLEAYFSQEFIHGVPYQEAHDFGHEALPTLGRFLLDEPHRSARPYIAAAIAFIGAPESYVILRRFLWEEFEGEVDVHTFRALLATPSLMGTIHRKEAVDDLILGVNPSHWKTIKWTFGHHRGDDLQLLLSKVAINGLSYTGSPQARSVLEQLKKKPYSERQASNIKEGLERHAKIASKGLPEYMRSQTVARPPQQGPNSR